MELNVKLPKYPTKVEILQLPHHIRKGAYKKLRKYKKLLRKAKIKIRKAERAKHGTQS